MTAPIPEELPLTFNDFPTSNNEPSYDKICYYNSKEIWDNTPNNTTLMSHRTRYHKHHFTNPNNSRGRSIHRNKNRRPSEPSPPKTSSKQNTNAPATERCIGAEFYKTYCPMATNTWKAAERDERPWKLKSRDKLAAA
jgi:hypothetical protein